MHCMMSAIVLQTDLRHKDKKVSVVIVISVLAGLFLIWVISGLRNEKRKERSFYQHWIHFDGKKPDKKKNTVDRALFKSHIKEAFVVDEITWNDLNMDLIFERLDYTNSSIGEEMLYRMLLSPCFDQDEIKHRDEVISFFQKNEQQRVRLQIQFAKIGRTGHSSVFELLSQIDNNKKSAKKDYFILICMLLSFLGAIFYGKALILFGILLIYNFMDYVSRKAQIGPYLASYRYILRMMKEVEKLSEREYPALNRELVQMQGCLRALNKFRKGAFIAVHSSGTSSNPLDLIWYYLCMVFHFDLMKFHSMQNQICQHKKEIVCLFETAGMLEAYLSISLFRLSISHYCNPVFVKEDGICFEDIYHPLLDEPICNSLQREQAILLTGSNASGKSTFLKTIAVNMIFAQTIATVLALHFEIRPGKVYSCMSLRDDITKGDSYFLAEIKAIKRILDACEKEETIYCFVDEVLRGTNTTERIAAATEILKQLQEQCSFCMAATHDLELTTLLGETYTNYHFEETLQNNDVKFSYKLKEGPANTQNAIELLRVLGFSSQIIENAKARANTRKILEEV